MLDSIGESPVNSLTSGLADAESAERVLDEVNRLVQAQGWNCNSVDLVQLTPDVDGYINLPNNTLKVDTTYTSITIDVTKRGTRLFDRGNNTYIFTDPVWVEIVYLLDYEELTFNLQNYILRAAAKLFQKGEISSITLDSFNTEDTQEAWAVLMEEEAENDDSNFLTDNYFSYIATYRNNPLNRT